MDKIKLTTYHPYGIQKPRRGDTLLTVDFNLRARDTTHTLQVPQGRHKTKYKVSSLRDLGCFYRFLSVGYTIVSPTVNKMLSLRDIILVEKELEIQQRTVRYAIWANVIIIAYLMARLFYGKTFCLPIYHPYGINKFNYSIYVIAGTDPQQNSKLSQFN